VPDLRSGAGRENEQTAPSDEGGGMTRARIHFTDHALRRWRERIGWLEPAPGKRELKPMPEWACGGPADIGIRFVAWLDGEDGYEYETEVAIPVITHGQGRRSGCAITVLTRQTAFKRRAPSAPAPEALATAP
jgi:hypothetical protein